MGIRIGRKIILIVTSLIIGALSTTISMANEGTSNITKRPLISSLETSTPNDVIARVNNRKITVTEYQNALKTISEKNNIPINVAKKLPILDDLIDKEILAQRAKTIGLNKNIDTSSGTSSERREILANTYIRYYENNNPITQQQLSAIYEEHKSTLWPKRYKLREIVVKQKPVALNILDKIRSGSQFPLLAQQHSVSESRNKKGLLDWKELKEMPTEAQPAIKGLHTDEWTDKPVEINGRWHIYLLEQTRQPHILPLDKMSDSIKRYARKKSTSDHIRMLHKNADIEIFSDITPRY